MFRTCIRTAAGLLVVAGAFTGCSDEPSTGTVSILLTDAPYPFDMMASVELVVDAVEIHVTAADGQGSGFHALDVADTIDVLELANGVTDWLGLAELPAGEVKQMRLVLSSAKVTLTDRTEFGLDVPSGESSGLKVRFEPPLQIVAGENTEVLFDVDVAASLTPRPPWATAPEDVTGFRFHPVLRVALLSDTGALAGRVTGTDGAPVEDATVSLRDGDVVVTSTSTDGDGRWAILGVAPGTWTVRAEAAGTTPVQTTADVVAGETTPVPGLTLE